MASQYAGAVARQLLRMSSVLLPSPLVSSVQSVIQYAWMEGMDRKKQVVCW